MLITPEGEHEIYCVDIDLSEQQTALRDRERAEEELRRAVAKNQALIDTIPDLILRVNRDGYYIDAIPSDEIEAAYPLDLVIGKCILDVLPPERAQERMYYLERAFQTGETQFHEYQIQINGRWQYEEARIVVSGNNEATILIRDITDRKQAEISLRESEARYRLLAENINDLVCLHDYDGKYLYVSPSCETLLGYRDDEMLGQSPYDFFHPDDRDRIRQEAHMSAIEGKANPITYRMRQKSGKYIWFETLTNPILDAMGQVIQLQTTSRDVTERIQAQNQLEYDAFHDSLTGLPNRHLLMERLELSIHRAKRIDSYHFAVLFLDLDRFKVINDSLGHLVGDKLLIAIAQKLQTILREIDLVARFGGDEFVILLDEIEDIQEAIHVTERIFSKLKLPLTIEGREVYTTASVGIVLGTQDYIQASHLLRDADIAMYRAKNSGKARYEIFDAEMHRQALIRMHLENDLRRAIDCHEFVMYYQPIVSLDNGYLIGFEALIRWQDPYQGFKYPNDFVPIAEEIGLISQLSHWALQKACHQLATWQTTFPNLHSLKICVNLSAQDLQRSALIEEVDRILAQTNLHGRCLTLEITESMLIDDVESTIKLLSQLKTRGIQISIDDFGTGYSSLNYLHRLPLDNLKVDRSFVSQMQDGKKNHQIVETISTLSNQLELNAIAEGIETPQQLHRLQNLGYKFGQGYLFSKPISQEAVEALLASNNLYLFP
ncbi:MAG: response regulator receiver protein [Pseudanabaena frigida]|uniref:Response regulator receiver protein n=1 Tax=Pseudanabaena frigida TaxID=945775 RepID=A0A2W4Y2F9_9CYAN|nr:MAG: response regulator receiver protein [Pseudanabaena frigida]